MLTIPTGTAFATYATVPNDRGEYQLRRTHRIQRATFSQIVRIEIMEETFPMSAKGRKEAADTVSVLNASEMARFEMGRAA